MAPSITEFWIDGQPPRKSNSRRLVGIKKGKPRSIKSQKALDWCESAAWQIPRAARLGLGSAKAPLSIVFHVFYSSRRPDLSVELILDVLQKNGVTSGVISDDRHVYHYAAFKHFDKEFPGVFVQIFPLGGAVNELAYNPNPHRATSHAE